MLKYFPRNPQGVSFSSKEYVPLGSIHRAPNQRLEITLKEHVDFLKSLDLQGLSQYLGISSNPYEIKSAIKLIKKG